MKMNLNDLVKKITALEDENRANNKTLSALNAKIKKVEESNASFLEVTRNLNKEVERMSNIVSHLGQFDSAITQVRVDFAKRISELDAQQKKIEPKIEKISKETQDAINKLQTSNKEMLMAALDKKMQSFFEEDLRLYQKVIEIQNDFEKNIKQDEALRNAAAANFEETERISSKMESFQGEIEILKKRLDEISQKFIITVDDLRKNETRLNELAAMENQRKAEQAKFIDQQSLLVMERDRLWNEWMQQFNENSQKTNAALQDLASQSQELKRAREEFNAISQRFERRMNELTEMYRILEERLRQDWETFKADEQKRWTNYSLVFGEKQSDFLNQLENTRNRLTALEDRTKETQEVFLMVSTELQKGMQGLLQMVNNWIQTFDDIHSTSQSSKPE